MMRGLLNPPKEEKELQLIKKNPSKKVFSVTIVRNGVICPRTAGIKKATKVLQRGKMSKEQTLHVKFQIIMKAWCLWM